MSDAAHVGSQKHIVFNKPLKIEPKVELWKTPHNYKDRRLANEPQLPDSIEVWQVQNSGKTHGNGSVVATKYGFTDSPDAEIIVEGFNEGKEYGAAGVSRHGNFLQWGYSQPPSKMTAEGKKLFLNCICYIKQFDGKCPLIRKRTSHRDNSIRLAALINLIQDPTFFIKTFPPELYIKYKGDPNGLVTYYMNNYELIYYDRVFLIQTELKALGIDSNRKIESLQKLINLLGDKEKASTAQNLLTRYTEQSFLRQDEWQQWLDKYKDRIFFSDTGGYKFFVIPEGYLSQ